MTTTLEEQASTLASAGQEPPPGCMTMPDGKTYMRDSRGALVPVNLVRPTEKLEDQLVRNLITSAKQMSDAIQQFKGNTFADVAAYKDLLAESYDTKVGGTKGNITFTSYDGCMKVQVSVADNITFGPDLQIAKSLLDALIAEWSAGANDNICALVNNAFQVDKEGQVNRAALFQLRRIEIGDERWKKAMDAINNSIRIVGSKAYVRFYERATPDGKWEPITIDLAAA